MILGIATTSFDFSIATRLVIFAEDLHHHRNSNDSSCVSPNSNKVGQVLPGFFIRSTADLVAGVKQGHHMITHY